MAFPPLTPPHHKIFPHTNNLDNEVADTIFLSFMKQIISKNKNNVTPSHSLRSRILHIASPWPDVWINQLQWKRLNPITQLNGWGSRGGWDGGAPVGTRLVWRRAAAARAVTISCLFKSGEARADGPYWRGWGEECGEGWRGGAGGAPEINLIWCPEDGWIPPQRHAVYEFREGFLVNRGERNESAQKMKTKWEEMRLIWGPHAYMHTEGKTGRMGATLWQSARWDSLFSAPITLRGCDKLGLKAPTPVWLRFTHVHGVGWRFNDV